VPRGGGLLTRRAREVRDVGSRSGGCSIGAGRHHICGHARRGGRNLWPLRATPPSSATEREVAPPAAWRGRAVVATNARGRRQHQSQQHVSGSVVVDLAEDLVSSALPRQNLRRRRPASLAGRCCGRRRSRDAGDTHRRSCSGGPAASSLSKLATYRRRVAFGGTCAFAEASR